MISPAERQSNVSHDQTIAVSTHPPQSRLKAQRRNCPHRVGNQRIHLMSRRYKIQTLCSLRLPWVRVCTIPSAHCAAVLRSRWLNQFGELSTTMSRVLANGQCPRLRHGSSGFVISQRKQRLQPCHAPSSTEPSVARFFANTPRPPLAKEIRPRAYKVGRLCIVCNRLRMVVSDLRGDTRRHSFTRFNAHGECGPVPALVFSTINGSCSRSRVSPAAQADDSAAFANQHGHARHRELLCGNDQVAFILTVKIVHKNEGDLGAISSQGS